MYTFVYIAGHLLEDPLFITIDTGWNMVNRRLEVHKDPSLEYRIYLSIKLLDFIRNVQPHMN